MLGEVVASVLLTVVVEKLSSALSKEFGLVWGLEDDLDRLQSILSRINAVLADAEEITVSENAVRNWLTKLKDAAYDINDLLDDLIREAERKKLELPLPMNKMVSCFTTSWNQVVFRVRMGHRIKCMRKMLDEIAAERAKFPSLDRPAADHR